jgi:lactaldehyde reductase
MIWNQTAYFGAGAVSVVPGELRSRGFAKALVVSTACWWAPASRAT